jgi:hypothetical protein
MWFVVPVEKFPRFQRCHNYTYSVVLTAENSQGSHVITEHRVFPTVGKIPMVPHGNYTHSVVVRFVTTHSVVHG